MDIPLNEGSVVSRTNSSSRSRSRSRSRSGSRSRSRSWSRSRSYSRSPDRFQETQSKSRKVLVKKLTKNVTKAHIQEIFGQYGKIRSIEMPLDRDTNGHCGIAHITYEEIPDAENALAYMNGGQLDGANLAVSFDEENGKATTFRRPSGGFVGRRFSNRGRGGRRAFYSPPRRHDRSKKYSPPRRRYQSRSPSRSRSFSSSRSRSYSRSPSRSYSRSRSPYSRSRSPSRSHSRSLSYSPRHD